MTTDKIQFTKEKETMLMTLSGRALQSQWQNPILRDPWAEEAMRHIDYDIGKQYKGVGSWRMWRAIGCTVIATRAATFDLLTTRFLADHPDAVVLQVGCGMDSRAFRVDPQDIKQLAPQLELVKEYNSSELVAFSRFPFWLRALFHTMDLNATLRRMQRILVYRY
jgi:O-methyltransferase involved in polyketide biosynthesis